MTTAINTITPKPIALPPPPMDGLPPPPRLPNLPPIFLTQLIKDFI
jgi:hypothetical protein